MSDLLDRLKSVRQYHYFPNDWKEQVMSEAAAEIERLQAENNELRTARQDRLDYVRAGYTKVLDELAECRRLLGEAVAECEVQTMDGTEYYPSNLEQRWFRAAREAAGGSDAA